MVITEFFMHDECPNRRRYNSDQSAVNLEVVFRENWELNISGTLQGMAVW
jgi:hypothetical protein